MKSQALDEALDEALTAAFPGASVCRLMNILIRSGIGATVVWSLAIIAGGQSSPRTVEWRHYGADSGTSRSTAASSSSWQWVAEINQESLSR